MVLLVVAGCSAEPSGAEGDEPGGAESVPPATSMPASTLATTTTVTVPTPSPGPDVPDDTGPPPPADGTLFPVGDVDAALAPWIDAATADLAARLDVDAGAVAVSSAVLVVWPDAGLGCPRPGMSYATVLTDGAVIELTAGDAVFRYHAGGSSVPFLCPRPIGTAPQRG